MGMFPVNGGWSSWSPWSGACDVDCVALRNVLKEGTGTEMIPKLRRVRMCNNPAPLNGGVYCFGEEEVQSVIAASPSSHHLGFQEFRSCNLTCRLDGRWSKWSEWSSCSPTCHRFRRRTCTSPPPTNAGRPCAGRDLETVTCSEE
ncbi:unnamed protein product [Cylicostephanus goldi]|uniref:Sema domain-containing protein n=1 Tax=Cylicostephanus goldi TaxID=71465 RepID=A0A3P6TC30_CYLGO|nr:unnamed protein product [Cylicostephanus goldi]